MNVLRYFALGLILFFGNSPYPAHTSGKHKPVTEAATEAADKAGPLQTKIQGIDLLTGKEVTVEFQQAKKGTVLFFLSMLCPCSISHEPKIQAIAHEFIPFGFQFLGIHSNQRASFEAAKAHYLDKGFLFPILDDSQLSIANTYEAVATPHAYVIAPNGKILFQGGVDNSHNAPLAKTDYLRNALLKIKEGSTDYEKEPRVLGCSITR